MKYGFGLIFLYCMTVAYSCRTTMASRVREDNFKYIYCTPTIGYEAPS